MRAPEVLSTQLRAILRVAADHPVKAMLPMVATLEELQAARRLLEEARVDTGISDPLELGIMVEVPAAALGAAKLAEQADFFSLGTNDLTQYTMAAERGNERLAALLTGPQPAVLCLIRETVEAAAQRRRPVGVRGAGCHRTEHGAGVGRRGQGGAARGRPPDRPGDGTGGAPDRRRRRGSRAGGRAAVM